MSTTIEDQRAKGTLTYSEDIAPGLTAVMELKSILAQTMSEYQKIEVIDCYFGRMLITDGKTQSAQFDEFAYHESLVHPPLLKSAMLAVDDDSKPKSVFIGGGGELATAREVLRHKSVDRVVMVDLDGKVIDVCKNYLPEWGGEKVASNARLELIVGDAYKYLMECEEKFDVIIMDISDPIEAGPGIMLYTKEFYTHCTKLLNSNGVFVTQAGVAESIPPPHAIEGEADTSCYGPILNTLKTVFDCAVPYATNIPSFGSDWGFVMAFNMPPSATTSEEKEIDSWVNISPSVLDGMIEQQISSDIIEDAENGNNNNDKGSSSNSSSSDVLKFYDGESHRHVFALSKPLRNALKKDDRIMTKENPIFMY